MRRCLLFLSHIGFNLLSVGMIVRQGRVYLRKTQMRIFEADFFRRHADLVPAYEPAYRQSGTCYLRPPVTYLGFPFDQRTDFDTRRLWLQFTAVAARGSPEPLC